MKKNSQLNHAWLTIVVLAIIPIGLWFLAPPSLPRFSSLLAIASSFGQLTALVGMALFSISLILSGRFIFLDKYFKGLNNVYAKHSLIGQWAFILFLIHPLLLIFKCAGGSLAGAVYFFSLSSDLPKNLGIMSLGLMVLLIVLTLYLRPKYNLWKITHKFFGLAFFLGSLHALLIPSDISRYAPLKFYMFSLAFLGVTVFVYRTILGKYLVKKYSYIIESVVLLNDKVWEISLKPQTKKLKFRAGQFIFISFIDPSISKESHPFTISSRPEDDLLKITVKGLGDYTNKMVNLKPGSIAKVEGPFGSFSHQNAVYKNQIWIAGGIGITPFLSMAQSLQKDDDYSIDLFYCLKNDSESIYLDFLRSLNPKLKVHLFCYDKSGYLNADTINNVSGALAEKDIFICAPMSMIESLKQQIVGLGVDKKLIHSEEFNF